MLSLHACWREVILPSESIRKGASIGKERILHFWNMLSLWNGEKENRLFGRLKCLVTVPFDQNTGGKFSDWSEEQTISRVASTCVWNYDSLRPLESSYCKD